MIERNISLEGIEMLSFFGVNERNLNFLRILFPDVILVQRGDCLIIKGGEDVVKEFHSFFKNLVNRYQMEQEFYV